MSRKSSVKVTIVGEEYTIRSDEPAEHTRAVAKYVDEMIRGVMNAGATFTVELPLHLNAHNAEPQTQKNNAE